MNSPATEETKATEASSTLLRDLIHERLGSFYDESNFYLLSDKLGPLMKMKGFTSLADFYFYLKGRPHFSDDWRRVMDALSVQETYFFREMDQINALTQILVPQWFQERKELLRIWIAACASGEEAFTIAIALNEAGYGNHPIEIIASDASEAALEKARAGIFRERALRSTPPGIREKYFTPRREHWSLSPDILRRVRLERGNLAAPAEIGELAKAPIIFCRNVFIYFSHQMIARVVRQFAEQMPPGGFLCVGASESLLKITKDFELKEIGNAFVYVRKPELSEPSQLK